jgi:hypothetical protein
MLEMQPPRVDNRTDPRPPAKAGGFYLPLIRGTMEMRQNRRRNEMRFKLEIDLGEIEGLRTGRNLAGILHGLATMMWTATEPLQPIQKYGITDPRFPEKTAGYWQVMPDDEEHIKRATALQSVAPHLSIVEALEATKQKPEPVADVCIAGAPAIDGQCGDRACVCSRYEPPTVEEWHSIADAFTAYGMDAHLEGGGAACTYVEVNMPNGQLVTVGDNSEFWTAAVYPNRASWEAGEDPAQTVTTDVPTKYEGTGRHHDPETIADAVGSRLYLNWKA